MSDAGRKDLTSQVSEKVTPDSQKSTTDKASENVSGAADKVASTFQSEDSKSSTQKAGDATRSGADDAQKEGGSYLESAQKGLSDAAGSVQNALGGGSK